MSAQAATQIGAREPLAPVRCATWCAEGDGHTSAVFPGDQYCHSMMLDLAASLHDDPGGVEDISVYVRKEPDEETPYVVVRTPDDAEIRLTTLEACRLTEYLEHMSWVAERDENARNAFELGRDFERGQQAP